MVKNRSRDTIIKPLFKWHLEHGLVITRIYTVVDYVPNTAFKRFAKKVAQARLDGDRDKDKALIAEMIKLIDNSSYGRMITNKEKHHDIAYVNESQVGQEIMDPNVSDLTELPDRFYEVEKTKKKVNLDLPVHIGVFISTMPNSKCFNFIMIVSINTFLVRTSFTVRWTQT